MIKQYLYLLECEQYYKIGISNNPKIRFTAIRTANHFEVKPVLCIFSYCRKKTALLEKELHVKFNKIQHRNEWFIKSFTIINLIKSKVENKDFFLFEDFESMYYGIASSELKNLKT